MSYTNLLRAMTEAAEGLTKRIATESGKWRNPGDGDVSMCHAEASLLSAIVDGIAAIEAATRPQSSGIGITSADAMAILDALASLRRADGGEG